MGGQLESRMDTDQKETILFVDDEESIIDIAHTYFTSRGYDVLTANNGKEAVELLSERRVDCCFTDINMPEMDGLVFLRELSRKFPSTSVIMITAYGGVESYLEAMNLGAYEYLHKPVRLDELRSVMKKIFNGGSIARVS